MSVRLIALFYNAALPSTEYCSVAVKYPSTQRLPFQRVHFLRVKCTENHETQIYRTTFIFRMALELFPSRQDAVKGAENINNTGIAIFHFTDGFEVYCISILYTTHTDQSMQHACMDRNPIQSKKQKQECPKNLQLFFFKH
jgi:hypothetical protein